MCKVKHFSARPLILRLAMENVQGVPWINHQSCSLPLYTRTFFLSSGEVKNFGDLLVDHGVHILLGEDRIFSVGDNFWYMMLHTVILSFAF